MTTLPMRWNGSGFDVLPRSAAEADKIYAVGEVYRVLTEEERSDSSHNHEFAFVREAWKTLPDHLADDYPSAEHLRKRALILAGFYDEQIIDVGTLAGAERVARSMRSREGEKFSHIVTRGGVVVARTARSQARSKMSRAEFQASKDGVLRVISEMLGVEPAQLQRAQAA